jgi:hypothetical protein
LEKVNIHYTTEARDYLNELIQILFIKNYFDYIANAVLYKEKIVDFIDNNIQKTSALTSPKDLIQFGSRFIVYKANARTSWYIFFEKEDSNFLITHITNNYTEEIKWLNQL